MKRFAAILRHSAKWVLLAAVAIAIVYRLQFAPTTVVGYTVVNGPLVAEEMGTGTLEARVKTTITPRIQERLTAVWVDQGDSVTQGQELAQLDDAEAHRLVEVAQATLAAAKATAARVQVDEARALAVAHKAQLDYERTTALMANNVSSQADVDQTRERLDVANVDLQRARAATLESQRQVVMAERTLAYQQERLAFTRMVSPYDGLIVRRDRDPGGVIVPGSSLLQLISTNVLWIAAWIDEAAMAKVATGQTARVVFRSEPDVDYPGVVARVGQEADRETREFIVDVQLLRLPPQWAVGQRAEVYIETARLATAVLVPERMIQWRDGRSGVYVKERGRAVWHDITLGLRGQNMAAVTQGLTIGMQAIAPRDTAQVLSDGRRVRVQ